jgi:hypothetical protein
MKNCDFAYDLPDFCIVFALVWKILCHYILQGICYFFKMYTPGCRKAFAISFYTWQIHFETLANTLQRPGTILAASPTR